MFKKENLGLIAALVGIGISFISVVIDIVHGRKIKKVAGTINKTVDELSREDFGVEIAKEFVEAAATRHTERRVDDMLPGVKADALRSARETFRASVNDEINKLYPDTRNELKRALKERIGNIDISDIKREVIEDAKDAAMSRFNDDLDRVVQKYVDRLDDAGDVWAKFKEKLG